jgi:hypothetical protein
MLRKLWILCLLINSAKAFMCSKDCLAFCTDPTSIWASSSGGGRLITVRGQGPNCPSFPPIDLTFNGENTSLYTTIQFKQWCAVPISFDQLFQMVPGVK